MAITYLKQITTVTKTDVNGIETDEIDIVKADTDMSELEGEIL